MITYRVTTDSDVSMVCSLLYGFDKSFPIPLSEKTNLEDLSSKLIANGYVYIAFDGDLPVGMVGFYANDTNSHKAYISVVGVNKSHQGRGIAKKMMIDCLSICKERGMTTCFLYTHKTNTGAITMYQKLGFVAEEDPNRPHDIKFVKEL